MKYLITKSLLEAWQYTFDCFEGFEDEARESFLKTLCREPIAPNEAMQNGIDFENAVYFTAAGSYDPTGHKWENGIRKVAEFIRFAPVQVCAQRDITVDGMDFVVYGILDALKAGTIYDVKFSTKSLSNTDLAGKYLTCTQHPAYFYIVPEATVFKYLVSDGEDIYVETYTRQESPFIGDSIRAFIRAITEDGLLETYKQYWGAKR